MKTTSLLTALALAVVPGMAQHIFYTLDLRTPGYVNITSLTGTMTIPDYPPGYPGDGGTYYLWPGLQGTNNNGVLQNVLEPGTSTNQWTVDSGYCCQNGIPFGGSIATQSGGEVYFNNFRNSDGTWTSQLSYPGDAPSTDNTFQLQGFEFNLAVFAIELYSASWNFGRFAFSDVTITWLGTDTSGCTTDNVKNYNGGDYTYAVTGASSSVENGEVVCKFESIVFEAPPS